MLMNRRFILVLLVVWGVGATLSGAPPDYHLLKKVNVGGTGAWDYLTYTPRAIVYLCRGECT